MVWWWPLWKRSQGWLSWQVVLHCAIIRWPGNGSLLGHGHTWYAFTTCDCARYISLDRFPSPSQPQAFEPTTKHFTEINQYSASPENSPQITWRNSPTNLASIMSWQGTSTLSKTLPVQMIIVLLRLTSNVGTGCWFLAYVDTNLLGTGLFDNAAILGQAGGVWATSSDFNVSLFAFGRAGRQKQKQKH
jgi:hypothetical protein